jgi:hypothetical protein
VKGMSMNEFDVTKFKKSSAGTTIMSPETVVLVDEKYSGLSWFFLYFFGTSQNPYHISFTCKKTNEMFCVMEAKEDIKNFMLLRPK